MEQFEADVSNGEVVDSKDYLKEEKVDYSNQITKILWGNKLLDLLDSNGEISSDLLSSLLQRIEDLEKKVNLES